MTVKGSRTRPLSRYTTPERFKKNWDNIDWGKKEEKSVKDTLVQHVDIHFECRPKRLVPLVKEE